MPHNDLQGFGYQIVIDQDMLNHLDDRLSPRLLVGNDGCSRVGIIHIDDNDICVEQLGDFLSILDSYEGVGGHINRDEDRSKGFHTVSQCWFEATNLLACPAQLLCHVVVLLPRVLSATLGRRPVREFPLTTTAGGISDKRETKRLPCTTHGSQGARSLKEGKC